MHKRRTILIIIILLVIIGIGIIIRLQARKQLKQVARQQQMISVVTIKAQPKTLQDEIILPGNIVAWHETPIYARTNGYIKQWLVDIGAQVKQGQLLAVIETPEVDAQLRQAQADLKTAMANFELAESTSKRWDMLLQTQSVSKQEADEKRSAMTSLQTTVNAARAQRDRLKNLVSYQRVVAPFAGIITSRATDVGNLINSGSTASRPLFSVSQANKLRVYVSVPQNYAKGINSHTQSYAILNDKQYPIKLVRTAKAIEPTTRTLLTEFVLDNQDYALFPGGYTQVHIKLPTDSAKIVIPVNTLVFRSQGLQVATVNAKHQVIYKKITLARDFGSEVEIASGLQNNEQIILNPPDSLQDGASVSVKTISKKNN